MKLKAKLAQEAEHHFSHMKFQHPIHLSFIAGFETARDMALSLFDTRMSRTQIERVLRDLGEGEEDI